MFVCVGWGCKGALPWSLDMLTGLLAPLPVPLLTVLQRPVQGASLFFPHMLRPEQQAADAASAAISSRKHAYEPTGAAAFPPSVQQL